VHSNNKYYNRAINNTWKAIDTLIQYGLIFFGHNSHIAFHDKPLELHRFSVDNHSLLSGLLELSGLPELPDLLELPEPEKRTVAVSTRHAMAIFIKFFIFWLLNNAISHILSNIIQHI
jgi:hypothetical protein